MERVDESREFITKAQYVSELAIEKMRVLDENYLQSSYRIFRTGISTELQNS